MTETSTIHYKGTIVNIHKGQKGGTYIIKNNKKKYLSASDIIYGGAIASTFGGIYGGAIFVRMNEQMGGSGISIKYKNKKRTIYVTKTGNFYYKEGGNKVTIQQDKNIYQNILKNVKPMIKNIEMRGGSRVVRNMINKETPHQTGGARQNIAAAGYVKMNSQLGGNGLNIRHKGKTIKVFITNSGKFYYKENNKKKYIQEGAGFGSIFGKIAKGIGKFGIKAAKMAAKVAKIAAKKAFMVGKMVAKKAVKLGVKVAKRVAKGAVKFGKKSFKKMFKKNQGSQGSQGSQGYQGGEDGYGAMMQSPQAMQAMQAFQAFQQPQEPVAQPQYQEPVAQPQYPPQYPPQY